MREHGVSYRRNRRAPPVTIETGRGIRKIRGYARTVLGRSILATLILSWVHSVVMADASDHRIGFLESGRLWDGPDGVMMFHWFMILFVIGLIVFFVASGIKDEEVDESGKLNAARQETPVKLLE